MAESPEAFLARVDAVLGPGQLSDAMLAENAKPAKIHIVVLRDGDSPVVYVHTDTAEALARAVSVLSRDDWDPEIDMLLIVSGHVLKAHRENDRWVLKRDAVVLSESATRSV